MKKIHKLNGSVPGGGKGVAISNTGTATVKSWKPMAVNYDKK